MRRSFEDTLAFLTGAAVGAGLMYVMDPDLGEPRRRYLSDRARDYGERATDRAEGLWESTKDTAGRLAGYAAGGTAALGAAGSYLGEQAGDLGSRFRKGSRRTWRNARDYGASAREQARGLKHRYWDREQEHDYGFLDVGTLVAAGAAVVAGMGIMYLMDPQSGRRRRKLIGDKAYSYSRQTGDYMSKTGRHLRNKARGMAHEAGLVGSDKARERRGEEDRGIVQRVRDRIGQMLGQEKASDIDVACEEGCVTLIAVDIPEEDRLINECRTVAGVTGVNVRRPGDVTNAPMPSGFTPRPTEGSTLGGGPTTPPAGF